MVIAVVGPTGIGKTKLSVDLAKMFDGEIINGDSTQIFQEANIGTAKVTDEEKDGIIHHLFDLKNLNEEYTVYDYQIDARAKIKDILSRNKTPIIVGGSNMYINALLYDYNFKKEDNICDLDMLSNDEMYYALKKLDLSLDIDRKNRQRLIRYYAKYINNSEQIEVDGTNMVYDAFIIGLTTDREILYERLNKRVDLMIEKGLIEETRTLYEKYPDSKQLHNMIDYKEIIEYINGLPLEDAIVLMKQNCRNYAKRQYTWLNHKMNVKWFDVDFEDFSRTVKDVEMYIKSS